MTFKVAVNNVPRVNSKTVTVTESGLDILACMMATSDWFRWVKL